MLKRIRIGNLELDNNVFLAPVSGITDIVFRQICREMGCGFTYSEMIIARGVIERNIKTIKMLEINDNETSFGVQIFGNEPSEIAEACRFLNDIKKVSLVDINMSCPAPKIIKRGQGVALMKNPFLAARIVEEAKKVSKKPVTVKIRKGFELNEEIAVKFSKIIENAGADAITIHGRTGKQRFSGKADWNVIKKLKENLKIPVIGNGDIFSCYDAEKMFNETGCDAVMIARGALGNPWIFKQIIQYFAGDKVTVPPETERIKMCEEHLKRALKIYDGKRCIIKMRKHFVYYLKGMKYSKIIRDEILREDTVSGIVKKLHNYVKILETSNLYNLI